MRNTHLYALFYFFFFNDTATTEIYTLSLHDALRSRDPARPRHRDGDHHRHRHQRLLRIVEIGEHTSELQSQSNLVCRLLLEKKKNYRSSPSTRGIRRRTTSTRLTTPAWG